MPKLTAKDRERLARRAAAAIETRADQEEQRRLAELERASYEPIQRAERLARDLPAGVAVGLLANVAGQPADLIDLAANPQVIVGGERRRNAPIVSELTSDALQRRILKAAGADISPELMFGLLGGGLAAMAVGGGGEATKSARLPADVAESIKAWPKYSNAERRLLDAEKLAAYEQSLPAFTKWVRDKAVEKINTKPGVFRKVEKAIADEQSLPMVMETLDPDNPIPRPASWLLRDKLANAPLAQPDPADLAAAAQKAKNLKPKLGEPGKTQWLRGLLMEEAEKKALDGAIGRGDELASVPITERQLKKVLEGTARMVEANKTHQPIMGDWYPDMKRVVAGYAGGDPKFASEYANMLAATSANKPVDASFMEAARAYQARMLRDPWRYYTNEMTGMMPAVVAAQMGERYNTPKFHAFSIGNDPNKVRVGKGPGTVFEGTVNDTHVLQADRGLLKGTYKPDPNTGVVRVLDPTKGETTPPNTTEHKIMDAVNLLVGRAVGMSPQEVQARKWGEKILQTSIAKGVPDTWDTRLAAMTMPSDIAYQTALKFTNELVPTPNLEKLPADPALREAYSRALERAVQGRAQRDAFLELLGQPGNVSGHGVGLFKPEGSQTWETNPLVVSSMPASFKRANMALDELSEKTADVYGNLRGLLTGQEGIASSLPVPTREAKRVAGVWGRVNQPLTRNQMIALRQALAERNLPQSIADYGDSSFLLGPWDGGVTGAALQKAYRQGAVQDALRAAGIEGAETKPVAVLSAYTRVPFTPEIGTNTATQAVLDRLQQEPGALKTLTTGRRKGLLSGIADRIYQARQEALPAEMHRPDYDALLRDVASPEARRYKGGPLQYILDRIKSGEGRYPVVAAPFLLGGLLSEKDNEGW